MEFKRFCSECCQKCCQLPTPSCMYDDELVTWSQVSHKLVMRFLANYGSAPNNHRTELGTSSQWMWFSLRSSRKKLNLDSHVRPRNLFGARYRPWDHSTKSSSVFAANSDRVWIVRIAGRFVLSLLRTALFRTNILCRSVQSARQFRIVFVICLRIVPPMKLSRQRSPCFAESSFAFFPPQTVFVFCCP